MYKPELPSTWLKAVRGGARMSAQVFWWQVLAFLAPITAIGVLTALDLAQTEDGTATTMSSVIAAIAFWGPLIISVVFAYVGGWRLATTSEDERLQQLLGVQRTVGNTVLAEACTFVLMLLGFGFVLVGLSLVATGQDEAGGLMRLVLIVGFAAPTIWVTTRLVRNIASMTLVARVADMLDDSKLARGARFGRVAGPTIGLLGAIGGLGVGALQLAALVTVSVPVILAGLVLGLLVAFGLLLAQIVQMRIYVRFARLLHAAMTDRTDPREEPSELSARMVQPA